MKIRTQRDFRQDKSNLARQTKIQLHLCELGILHGMCPIISASLTAGEEGADEGNLNVGGDSKDGGEQVRNENVAGSGEECGGQGIVQSLANKTSRIRTDRGLDLTKHRCDERLIKHP